ncbi:transposase [Nannocystis pusilla]|uniref:transposase n=1 Tax=Nannocystis pusilla TaxID=889268 RepID=UPI003B7816FE
MSLGISSANVPRAGGSGCSTTAPRSSRSSSLSFDIQPPRPSCRSSAGSSSRRSSPDAYRGAQVVYQPPYSPDLNPIELAWSKIKAALRGLGARTVPLLKAAICAVSGFVTPVDAAGWFKHCGVSTPQGN